MSTANVARNYFRKTLGFGSLESRNSASMPKTRSKTANSKRQLQPTLAVIATVILDRYDPLDIDF